MQQLENSVGVEPISQKIPNEKIIGNMGSNVSQDSTSFQLPLNLTSFVNKVLQNFEKMLSTFLVVFSREIDDFVLVYLLVTEVLSQLRGLKSICLSNIS